MTPVELQTYAHEAVNQGITALIGALCTWLVGRVKRIYRDANCYFARSRAQEEDIVEATSFEDFQKRVAKRIKEREEKYKREIET